MKCNLNYKLGILLVISVLLLVIVIKKGKIAEKFSLFREDARVKAQILEHDTMMRNQQQQDFLLAREEERKEKINQNKDLIYQLRERFLLLKQYL